MKILTLLLLSLSSLVFAQTTKEEFKVLSHKGANTVNGEKLATGTKLYAADKISVAAGGFIGLLHKSGKTLELRTPGNYVISEISQKVVNTNTSASKRYADYVVKELTKGDKEDINKNYMKNLTVTGSVERGGESLKLFIPHPSATSTTLIYSNNLKINWTSHKKASVYVVKISNNFDEIIFSQDVTDTTYTINVDQLKLNGDSTFNFTVNAKNDINLKSDKRQVKLIRDQKLKELNEEIAEINANLSEESSTNYFMKATFFNEKGLFVESAEYYKKAIIADPEVIDYLDSYNLLLKQNGLDQFSVKK